MNHLFDLDGVRMIFGDRPVDQKIALDVPSLSLEAGVTYAFVGPNGAGKTTLISILAGLLIPTRGWVRFEGSPVPTNGRQIESRRKMTLMMQSPWLFRGTVLFNVAYGLRARGVSRRESMRRVSRILDEVGLSGFEERKVNGLSGGEAQRVALARALAPEPEVLLLDEPTSNLDSESCACVERVMERISSSHRSLIFTTHHHALAEACRVEPIRMEEGRLLPRESDPISADDPQPKSAGCRS